MSCNFIKQPIPATLKPDYPGSHQAQTENSFSIDQRVHQCLKSLESTIHLKGLLSELNNRHKKLYNQIVFPEQIISLRNATLHIESLVEQEVLRCDEMEHAYIRLSVTFAEIAYFAPRTQNRHKDSLGSLLTLTENIKNIIQMNNTLVMKFEILDDSHGKLETRRLKGLLYRTNYFLEYKNFHIHRLIKML